MAGADRTHSRGSHGCIPTAEEGEDGGCARPITDFVSVLLLRSLRRVMERCHRRGPIAGDRGFSIGPIPVVDLGDDRLFRPAAMRFRGAETTESRGISATIVAAGPLAAALAILAVLTLTASRRTPCVGLALGLEGVAAAWTDSFSVARYCQYSRPDIIQRVRLCPPSDAFARGRSVVKGSASIDRMQPCAVAGCCWN